MLEILTFTGVDVRTDFGALTEIVARYPKVEFGVLVGTQSSDKDNCIFPPLTTVRKLAAHAGWTEQKVAIHLCGRWAREIMGADGAPGATYGLCDGFGRVQVNLHGDFFDPSYIDAQASAISRFTRTLAEENPDVRVILQHRGPWAEVPVRYPRVEYLFDRSGGSGRAQFSEWPDPEDGKTRYGYAGGIGPETIGEAMAFVNRWPTVPMWLDMEGRIRTNGWLDLEKVESVCAQAFDMGNAE